MSSRYATGSWSRATERYGRHGWCLKPERLCRSVQQQQQRQRQQLEARPVCLSALSRERHGGLVGCRGGRNKAKEATSSRFRELEWRGRGRGKGKGGEKEKEQKKEDEQKNRGWREHDGLGRSAAVLLIWVGSAKAHKRAVWQGCQFFPSYGTVAV